MVSTGTACFDDPGRAAVFCIRDCGAAAVDILPLAVGKECAAIVVRHITCHEVVGRAVVFVLAVDIDPAHELLEQRCRRVGIDHPGSILVGTAARPVYAIGRCPGKVLCLVQRLGCHICQSPRPNSRCLSGNIRTAILPRRHIKTVRCRR